MFCIAMTLSAVRRIDGDDFTAEMTCSDRDFDLSLAIVKVLLVYTIRTSASYPSPQAPSPPPSRNAHRNPSSPCSPTTSAAPMHYPSAPSSASAAAPPTTMFPRW